MSETPLISSAALQTQGAGSGNAATELEIAFRNCRRCLEQDPDNVDHLHAMAYFEYRFGRLDSAMEWTTRALAKQPDRADILCTLGVVLNEKRQFREAESVIRRAIDLIPDNSEFYFQYGNALNAQQKTGAAIAAYQQSITLNARHVAALNNLGIIYTELSQFQAAIKCFTMVLDQEPNHFHSLNNMGRALISLGQYDEALGYLIRADALSPDKFDSNSNLGALYHLQGRYREAYRWYRQALALNDTDPRIWNNLGKLMKDLGEFHGAIMALEKSLRLADDPEKHFNLALALLASGNFEEGWKKYEWRWKTNQLNKNHRSFPQPVWQGDPGSNQRLMIHAEQGFGDTLQFARYATMAAGRGFRVILEVQPELARLMQSLPGIDQVIAHGDPLPDFDFHCPMMSLPLIFQTRPDTIPVGDAYLFADPVAITAWKRRLDAHKTSLKVGLVWAGNARIHFFQWAADNKIRSLDPEFLAPLADLTHVTFFSLQKNAETLPDGLAMINYMDECQDFADTAALIANLDLVISVDTSVAHLASALGKPVWLLNRFNSCWRWERERTDTPWYPQMRIFHQREPGNWQDVITAVRHELQTLSQPKIKKRRNTK